MVAGEIPPVKPNDKVLERRASKRTVRSITRILPHCDVSLRPLGQGTKGEPSLGSEGEGDCRRRWASFTRRATRKAGVLLFHGELERPSTGAFEARKGGGPGRARTVTSRTTPPLRVREGLAAGPRCCRRSAGDCRPKGHGVTVRWRAMGGRTLRTVRRGA